MPERVSERLALLLLLQRIERIQVTHHVQCDRWTFYGIAVYLRQFQSRIPTSSRKDSDLSSVTTSKPHFQIERRISEFRKLRTCIHMHAFDWASAASAATYPVCLRQREPATTADTGGPDQVLPMLMTFLNDLLALSVGSKGSSSRVCESRERTPGGHPAHPI